MFPGSFFSSDECVRRTIIVLVDEGSSSVLKTRAVIITAAGDLLLRFRSDQYSRSACRAWKGFFHGCMKLSQSASETSGHIACGPGHNRHCRSFPSVSGGVYYTGGGDGVVGSLGAVFVSAVGGNVA